MRIIEGFRLRQVMGQATIIGEGIGQIDFNKLITLNTTAAYLWQSVEDKVFSIDDLAGLLMERFRIDPAIAQRDASAIAREWMASGIVQE
ncbi:PqqD family protein [Bacteroides fragilis]|uniref:PqqD family protein n=1 Tax=Bacteroides fragilis TaxID=817 RepID=UPI0028118E1F|nr:PqqD family protein [Bacteroides fragilis]WMI96502.1 PqqD family protein [Bacteroides fragilis]